VSLPLVWLSRQGEALVWLLRRDYAVSLPLVWLLRKDEGDSVSLPLAWLLRPPLSGRRRRRQKTRGSVWPHGFYWGRSSSRS
jgi:hypothetical protein